MRCSIPSSISAYTSIVSPGMIGDHISPANPCSAVIAPQSVRPSPLSTDITALSGRS